MKVETAGDLINAIGEASWNPKEVIDLVADLDFSGAGLTIPLGASSGGSCISYSGVFHGNGHTIKGIQMNTTGKQYSRAGVFCGIKDATVENLVIDSSCSFIGYYVGALGVSVTGSLVVKNVTNKAFVNGTYEVGGFIGTIEEIEHETVVSFENCTNDGNVSASHLRQGGFVGYITSNTNIAITFSDCINNGAITGNMCGGFVGLIGGNTNITMDFSNCTNNNFVSGSREGAGGFLGKV